MIQIALPGFDHYINFFRVPKDTVVMTPTFPRSGMGGFGCSVSYGYLSSFNGGWLQVVIGNDQEKKLNKRD